VTHTTQSSLCSSELDSQTYHWKAESIWFIEIFLKYWESHDIHEKTSSQIQGFQKNQILFFVQEFQPRAWWVMIGQQQKGELGRFVICNYCNVAEKNNNPMKPRVWYNRWLQLHQWMEAVKLYLGKIAWDSRSEKDYSLMVICFFHTLISDMKNLFKRCFTCYCLDFH
jgi:hypothetical protein